MNVVNDFISLSDSLFLLRDFHSWMKPTGFEGPVPEQKKVNLEGHLSYIETASPKRGNNLNM